MNHFFLQDLFIILGIAALIITAVVLICIKVSSDENNKITYIKPIVEKDILRSILVGYNTTLLFSYDKKENYIELEVIKKDDNVSLANAKVTRDLNSNEVISLLYRLEKQVIQNLPKYYKDTNSSIENLSWDLGSFINAWLSLIDQTNIYTDIYQIIDNIFSSN